MGCLFSFCRHPIWVSSVSLYSACVLKFRQPSNTNIMAAARYISNPMIIGKPKQEECIFCLGDEQPTLTKNNKCDCQYFYHSTCMQEYEERLLLDRKPIICLMCRKETPSQPQPQSTQYVTVVEIIRIRSQPTRKCKIVLACIGLIIFSLFLMFSYRLFF